MLVPPCTNKAVHCNPKVMQGIRNSFWCIKHPLQVPQMFRKCIYGTLLFIGGSSSYSKAQGCWSVGLDSNPSTAKLPLLDNWASLFAPISFQFILFEHILWKYTEFHIEPLDQQENVLKIMFRKKESFVLFFFTLFSDCRGIIVQLRQNDFRLNLAIHFNKHLN